MKRYGEIKRTYVALGKFPLSIPCMLYEPLHPEEERKVGIVLMHSDDDYIEFIPAMELAKRGYLVAAAHVSKASNSLDIKISEVAQVVNYLKCYPGVEKVLLLGHSGGATLMSLYQNVAENGVEAFQGPERIIPMDDIGIIPAADGVMLLDANFGNGVMSLISLDPSIIDESIGVKRDPKLDMFNPANGYDTSRCRFSDEFIKKYFKAQAERMNRLIDYCQKRIELIKKGEGRFVDDEPIIIPGGTQFAPNNKLFPQITKFFSHTRDEQELIHKDGSVTKQIVTCLRKMRPGVNAAIQYEFGALNTTVKTFLKNSAIRVDAGEFGYDETTIYGIDWNSSYCVTVGNVEEVKAPMLIMGMTGGYEYIASEHVFRHALKCADKTLAFVEGASHNFEIAPEAENYPGELGDTVKSCFDYVGQWIDQRFI